ncbi:hypothetical protein [Spirosoma areae]
MRQTKGIVSLGLISLWLIGSPALAQHTVTSASQLPATKMVVAVSSSKQKTDILQRITQPGYYWAAFTQRKSTAPIVTGHLADNSCSSYLCGLRSPDLTPILLLPQANFPAGGSVNNFVVQIFEVAGLPTSMGSVAITITAPLGYSLAFSNDITSINVSGGTQNPVSVDNLRWTLSSVVGNQQLSLVMKPGQFIGAGGTTVVGFSLTRTNANSGSSSNITMNVTDDVTKSYDGDPSNNVYVRIISGL